MPRIYLVVIVVTGFLISCSVPDKQKGISDNHYFSMYSNAVQDSFVISVQLPEAYNETSKAKYDVVYVLDGNFHFPMIATTMKQYEKAGLLPPLIVVGIGYRSLEQMDSLRDRDYLYPAALPSDEIHAIGGARNFNNFITKQLIPYIDSAYHTNTTNRSLLGHSFGGYFSLFALLEQLNNHHPYFNNFIAASPSVWYNNFYMNRLTQALKNNSDSNKLHLFLSVGGLEDPKWNIAPVKKLADSINKAAIPNVQLQYRLYNELEHMDVAQLSFAKGLQQFYTHPQDSSSVK